MEIQSLASHSLAAVSSKLENKAPENRAPENVMPGKDDPELREAFQDFVGQTFFGQMLSAMRQTVGKPAYMHGGRTEEVFQAQFDQVLAEKLSDASAETFSEPMYQLFTLSRR